MKILLVENDKALGKIMVCLMQSNGMKVRWILTRREAMKWVKLDHYDCLTIDIKFPRDKGITFITKLRALGCASPLLVLSSHNAVIDRVGALNAGADDYLGKPFDNYELLARINALVRRSNLSPEVAKLTVGNGTLFYSSRTLVVKQSVIELSQKEFLLLEYFAVNSEQILTHEQIEVHVWGPDVQVADNSVQTYIYFLRKKCNKIGLKPSIQTIRGLGYRLG